MFTLVRNNRLDAWAEMYGIYVEAEMGSGVAEAL